MYLKNSNYKIFQKDFLILKYYLCMRLLTPIKLTIMEEKDKIIILTLMVMFYNKANNLVTLKKLMEGE